MLYVIANLKKAQAHGFMKLGHATRGEIICLNEKEVMNSEGLSGTLDERAKALGGAVATLGEAQLQMTN